MNKYLLQLTLAILMSIQTTTYASELDLDTLIAKAEQGDMYAHLNVGAMYYLGLDVTQDYS